ncbi:MAG: response regulator [Spirochaetota bacterium]
MRKITQIFCLCLLQLLLSFCQNKGGEQLLAKDGVLDLRKWNFAEQGSVALRGEWLFYWKKFISPVRDFDSDSLEKPSGLIDIPGNWSEFEKDASASEMSGSGYASLKLRILLDDAEDLVLYTNNIDTAYKLYINGELLGFAGKNGKTAATTVPMWKSDILEIASACGSGEYEEVVLVLHLSNFHNRVGGIWSPFILGKRKVIRHMESKNLGSDFFLAGSIFIMGMYHIGLFLLRKNDKSPICFAVFCLLISFRTLLVGDKYLFNVFPRFVSWEIEVMLGYLTFYLGVPSFMLYFQSLFPEETNSKVSRGIIIASLLLSLPVLFLPARIYTHGLFVMHLLALIACMFGCYCVVRAIMYQREGAKIFATGFSIFTFLVVNSLLYNNYLASLGDYSSLGLFILIFSQTFLLSNRFSKAFVREEELSEDLERQNEKLQNLDKLKDEFLSNTSHELRTPLHGIIGIAESLMDGVSGSINSEGRRNLEMIVSSGKRLSNLINDILDFSKLKNYDFELQIKAVDIRSVTDFVCHLLTPLLGNKKVQLLNEIHPDTPLVFADENRLQQILINLVGNAIKFTEEGHVQISARLEESGTFLYIDVSDTGIGIAAEKQEIIYESFQQADGSISREYAGTGIGLAVAKKLIELHQGSIHLSSEIGKGSTFCFTMPVAENIENVKKQQPTAYKALLRDTSQQDSPVVAEVAEKVFAPNTKTVVIIDDEPMNLQVLKNQLGLQKYRVLATDNGQECLQLLETEKPDLLLVDLMMPRMNGYEVVEAVRKKYNPVQLPIIMLTAKNQVTDITRGFALGINDYMVKPFAKDELFARVRTHIELAGISLSYHKFVPNQLIQLLDKESVSEISLGDNSQLDMTVLFSDIRDFTTLSEYMTVEENFAFINSYLKRMEPHVEENRGFIDKFIGDAIMALFPKNPEDGINTGIGMLEELYLYNQYRKQRGYQRVSIGIGVHSGNVILGIVGGKNRMDGTAISDTVNLAFRLEGLTKMYHASFITSEHTLNLLPNKDKYFYRKIDTVKVKGKDKAVGVVEILNGNSQRIIDLKLNTKEDFELGMELYHQRKFYDSKHYFQKVLSADPKDKAAEIILNRAIHYEKNGIPPDWEFAETLKHK